MPIKETKKEIRKANEGGGGGELAKAKRKVQTADLEIMLSAHA